MMNTEQTKPKANAWAELREKQDRIIAICKDRGFEMDVPVSDLQYGCPTANELKQYVYPAFSASLDSFLSNFDKS